MKELIAAVLSEDENGNFGLGFHLDDTSAQTVRVDKLLSALLQARVGMQPPPSTQVPKPGEISPVIFGSGWWVDPTLDGTLIVRLHHPALGWLSWAMPPALAKDMATKIIELADQTTKPPGQVQ